MIEVNIKGGPMLRAFGLLILVSIFLSGCCSSRYNTNNIGVGVSGMINDFGELDLSKDLDASLLPDLISKCYEEGLQAGSKGDDLQRFVVRKLSEKIREISTIDLNGDGTTDPILVIPEGDEEQMTFSVRVPNPDEVKSYPPFSDASAWQDIGQNKSVEVVAVTAVPKSSSGKVSSLEFESRPSSAYYSSSQYYHHSLASNYLSYMVMRDLFFRPHWYGPSYYGWYGGYYRPYRVSRVYSSRRTVTRRYSSGKGSYNRLRTSSGTIPNRSKGAKLASKKSFSSARNVRKNLKSGGFGRSASKGSSRGSFGRKTSRSKPSTSRRSSRGSSRGLFSSRSSGGGFRWGK
jgi:hypothetical protein